jgi:superfamily II DNA or RNA helicase/HKD family nuclease
MIHLWSFFPRMSDFKEGLYDQLVTRHLRESLDRQTALGLKSSVEAIEEIDCPGYLARHLIRQIKSALRNVSAEDRKRRQIELANSLLDFLSSGEDLIEPDPVDPPGEVLRAIYRGAAAPEPPSTPLSTSSLLMNALDEPRLGFELEREMATADRVFMVVSFIQWRGWQRLKSAFHELAAHQVPIRILTTTYIGATDFRAIEELSRLPNVELKISLDGRRRRLHAKAWLFQRDNGFSSVYVGSANLSGPALEDGIEWTVKLSEVEAPHIVERFRGAFDSLWCDEEFEQFRQDDEDLCRRVRLSLEQARQGPGRRESGPPVFFDLRPHPYQQATLDQLETERVDRGYFRNLGVAPTGTGKTLIAAFDYARQPFFGSRPRLLFLAHREELLRQARDRFRHVLRDESFGELLGGGAEPASYDHLFATIQSLRSRGLLESQGAGYWEYVVLDEAHHVPADSYREIVASIQPRILLGLTATPERMDGESILPWFDHRIADEMRLWHAIERQYLVPFDYYGVHDGTDLSGLSWTRGCYAIGELEQRYLGNTRRAGLIISEFCDFYGDWRQARAIGFCVSIAHAQFMAQSYRDAGIPALAITSESAADERARAASMLRNREVNVLFTVDLFNEGVDIPEVDCVLFLRPTESATVYLQQLGRGLRLDTGKTSCLVLDFIGNQRREFRFDQRFRAVFGGTRQQVVRQIETGITRLPGNCYFRLDKESRKIVLENLKAQLQVSRAKMVAELRALAAQLQRCPTLIEYLAETRYELADIYKPSVGGWHAILSEGQLLAGSRTEADTLLSKRFQLLLHMDSTRRLRFYLDQLGETPASSDSLLPIAKRMVEMLTFRLLQNEARQQDCDWATGLRRLCQSTSARGEFREFCGALLDRVRLHTDESPLLDDCPLFLHRQYTRDEVLVGLGLPELVGARHTQTGRFWSEATNTEIFFVTLDKSEKAFSPSTRYDDFALSPTRFHWQSQSTTGENSPTGQRYVRQRENGATFLLFVRAKKGDAFLFLGPVRYVSHSGSRPMSIYWDLDHPLPAWFFDICASLRAA